MSIENKEVNRERLINAYNALAVADSKLESLSGRCEKLERAMENQNLGVSITGAEASLKKVNYAQAQELLTKLESVISERLEQLAQVLPQVAVTA